MAYTLDEYLSPNCNHGNYSKKGFVIHHAATTDFAGIGRTFQDTSRQTSAHYGVEPGHVQRYVRDSDVAWHAGDKQANRDYIGIECVNSGGAAQGWPVAEATIDTLCEFMTDKARELGITKLVVGQNLFGHRDFSATFCPGVLYPRLGEIAARVNALLAGTASAAVESRRVILYPQNGTEAQLFIPQWNVDRSLTLINVRYGLALDRKGSGTANGTGIWAYTPNGTDAQKWDLVQLDGGYIPAGAAPFKLVPHGLSGMALDVPGSNFTQGQELQLYDDNGTLAQQFYIFDAGNGIWEIVSNGAGHLAVDVTAD